MTFSLGPFNFFTFHRAENPAAPPLRMTERGMIVQRPGVDDTGVIRHGEKGRPFTMLSQADVLTHSAGQTLAELYEAAVLLATYPLVWADVDYESSFQTRYVILEVEAASIRRVGAIVGGLNGASGNTVVVANWLLLPVAAI